MKQESSKTLSKGLGVKLYPYFRIVFFALVGFLFSAPAFATTVSLNARPNQISGVEFSIDVILDSVSDMYGAAFDLKYDPDFLDVVDSSPEAGGIQPKAIEGDFLNLNGADRTFVRAALEDGVPGTLVIGITRVGDAGGLGAASEAGVIAASFIPKKFGTTEVVFGRQALKDSDNADIPVSAWERILLNIIPQYGNIDGNETIDLRDAILTLQFVTKTPAAPIVYPEGAVQVYGKIGVETAVYVLQVLGEMRN